MTQLTGDPSGDVSLLYTLRALVVPRMNKDNGLELAIYDYARSASSDLSKIMFRRPNALTIVRLESDGAMMDDLAANGFVPIVKVQAFFRETNISCMMNRQRRATVLSIQGNHSTRDVLHRIQCAIPALLPWYFPTFPTGVEAEVLQAMQDDDVARYLKAMREIARSRGLSRQLRQKTLEDFLQHHSRAKVKSLEETISHNRLRIENLIAEIRHIEEKIDDDMATIYGYQNEKPRVCESLFDPDIDIEAPGDGRILMTVRTFAWSDVDEAAETIRSPRENFTSVCPENREDMRRLLHGIFVTGKYRLAMVARLAMDYYTIIPIRGELNISAHIDNPHMSTFQCAGTFASAITEALRDGDMDYAVALGKAMSGNINFRDSTVMRHFILCLWQRKNDKILRRYDGTPLSVLEAFEEMKND